MQTVLIGPQKNELDHTLLRDILECDQEYLDRPAYVCRMVVLLYSYEDD